MKPIQIFLILICSLAIVAGCGKPKAKLIPGKGVVKINGEPAADIMVQFVFKTSDEAVVASTSQALTNSNGEFELVDIKTNEPGVMEGTHIVTLLDTLEERPAQGEVASKPPRVDPSFMTKGIEVTVSPGSELTIEATGPK